jgi:hypothetical protein
MAGCLFEMFFVQAAIATYQGGAWIYMCGEIKLPMSAMQVIVHKRKPPTIMIVGGRMKFGLN